MKTLDEIYREMLDCFGERTGMGLSKSCDLAARLYALAAQIYSLQIQADWVKRQAFPQTAEGEFLDRHAELRGLTRKEATAARGVVRFFAGEAGQGDCVLCGNAFPCVYGAAGREFGVRIGADQRYAGGNPERCFESLIQSDVDGIDSGGDAGDLH